MRGALTATHDGGCAQAARFLGVAVERYFPKAETSSLPRALWCGGERERERGCRTIHEALPESEDVASAENTSDLGLG